MKEFTEDVIVLSLPFCVKEYIVYGSVYGILNLLGIRSKANFGWKVLLSEIILKFHVQTLLLVGLTRNTYDKSVLGPVHD